VATTPQSLSDLLGIEAASRTATVEGTAVAAIAVECSVVVAIVVVAAAAEPAVTAKGGLCESELGLTTTVEELTVVAGAAR